MPSGDAGSRPDTAATASPGFGRSTTRTPTAAFSSTPTTTAEAVHRPERTESGPWIDHLWLGVADLQASLRFWETVVPVLGLGTGARERLFIVGGNNRRHFALVADGRPPTENLHLAFPVAGDEAVAEFHRIATAAGYRDNGPPGERPEYHPGYVGAFVLDPNGWNVEAVNHNR